MTEDQELSALPVPERLLRAAQECFLNDEYHKVTTRQIAALAGSNISMIRYYFGSKEGLYEEMIRQTLEPLLEVFDRSLLSSTGGFSDFFRIYYRTMLENSRFPALILKVLALNQGPGKRFIFQLLERGRERGRAKVDALKQRGQMDTTVEPDILRISFVSLAMMPILLKDIFSEQLEREIDMAFFETLARFNGRLFAAVLTPDN